ncbi:MAG: hypothetical protein RLZZ618_3348 [Pseudomonadota bacterium]
MALINDILDLSKIEAGQVPVLVEPVPIVRTLEGLLGGLKPIATQKGLPLEFVLGAGLPDVTHTGSDGLAAVAKRRPSAVLLDVNLPDFSGLGVLDQLKRSSATRHIPVHVVSVADYSREALGMGAIGYALKPVRREALVDALTHMMEDRGPQALRRVLVVEDDVRNIFALSSVLEPLGATVQIARNRFEALDALARSRSDAESVIDLVLMDIMMPEMDCITAMREIRKKPEWKNLAMIALTAKAMKDDQEMCRAAGANDYTAKPLDVERLLSLVRVWMPGHRNFR